MATDLSFSYDAVGDILFVQARPPYASQYSVLEAGGTVIRRAPDSGDIERVELMGFSLRTPESLGALEIPEAFKALILSLKIAARAA